MPLPPRDKKPPFEPKEAPKPTHGYKNPCCDFSPVEQETEDSLTCAGCNHCDPCHKGYYGDDIGYGCEIAGVAACEVCAHTDECREGEQDDEEDDGLSYEELCDAVWGVDYEGEMDWDDAPGFHD